MNAALIGLIGVVAGALLTGAATLWVDENKRRKSAAVAAYLIAGELATAQERIKSALEADPKQWWLGDLPTRAWQDQLMDLGFRASPELLQNLADAYRIIDRLNVDRGQAALPETELQNIDLPAIRIVKEKLDGIAKTLAVKPKMRNARRWGFWVAAGLIFVVALIAVIVPQPDINSKTMAAVVETWFGSHSLASCNPQGVDWSCDVIRLSGSRSACRLEASSLPTSTSAGRVVTASLTSNSDRSEVSGAACTDTAANHVEVSTVPGRVVGLSQTPSQIERAKAAQRIFASNTPEQRPISAFLGWIKNLVHV